MFIFIKRYSFSNQNNMGQAHGTESNFRLDNKPNLKTSTFCYRPTKREEPEYIWHWPIMSWRKGKFTLGGEPKAVPNPNYRGFPTGRKPKYPGEKKRGTYRGFPTGRKPKYPPVLTGTSGGSGVLGEKTGKNCQHIARRNQRTGTGVPGE